MRPVLWLLVLFALAVALALTARFDEGYVLVVVPPWRLEMSFMLATVAMLVLFAGLYLAFRVLNMTLSLPDDVRAWRGRRRTGKTEDELGRAIAAYLSGQPAHAGALAAKAYQREPRPMIALVAVHAALALNDTETARRFLDGLKTEQGEMTAARQAAEARLADMTIKIEAEKETPDSPQLPV